MFIATDTLTIDTPTAGTDAYGYPDPAAGGWTTRGSVAGHLAEREPVVETYAADAPAGDRTFRAMRALLPRGTTVAKGDRITTAAGEVYLVEHVWRDHDALGVSPVRVDLVGAGVAA